jgi:hypothetical protein
MAAPAKEEFLRELRQEAAPSVSEAGEQSPLLFFELPGEELRGARAAVDFKVHTGGLLWLHERLAFEVPAPGAPAAVELLGWSPEKLVELRRLAAEPGSDVRISVWLDGRQLRTFNFADFVRYNEGLAQTGFRPVEVRPEILVPAVKPASGLQLEKYDVACGEECGRQYDECERYCDPYGGPTGCEQCREDLYACQDWCSVCPTVKEWTETRLVDVLPTYQPWVCLAYRAYDPVTARYKITRYRRTVSCDYVYTTTVLSVRYVDQPCYYDRLQNCSPSFGQKPTCIIPWNYPI